MSMIALMSMHRKIEEAGQCLTDALRYIAELQREAHDAKDAKMHRRLEDLWQLVEVAKEGALPRALNHARMIYKAVFGEYPDRPNQEGSKT
jgi:hypothetical protein